MILLMIPHYHNEGKLKNNYNFFNTIYAKVDIQYFMDSKMMFIGLFIKTIR